MFLCGLGRIDSRYYFGLCMENNELTDDLSGDALANDSEQSDKSSVE